ncbi:M56 family metallopeptidase [Parabacteroides gordonii]|uniref:TonB family domain-containing protein n=1 Tax=Parabacteroides gordonii MS-1 = DSM 23371 TaxID=1203610 RepID=A0A0F5JMB0_9BACT|nr:M56 family metallopeptidase [Parabacteroides gordonii]KKB58849.1 TonB family domain-containing protein [Parabacteroides gordonii MS-1 = DSM 23371]MCA5583548.1 M56 family metallopeptidase [Parabacteroides gordonii]
METSILPYFLKVNLALAILYICYRLLFRNDTFFRLRRAVLLSVYLIAFLYPLLDISIWLSTRESVTEIVNYYSTILPLKTVVAADDTPLSTEADWLTIAESYMLLIYLAGITLLFLRCIIELFTVIRLRLRSPKQLINGTTIYVLPSQEEPYSFFGWIFASPESHTPPALEEILVHEKTHVRQLHSIDVVLGEIVCILCWINPFVWLLKKEISSNHEYLADEQVMLAGYNKKEYQYHLIGLEHPEMAIAKLYNNFSVLPLKKRITMLNKKRTGRVGKVKYLTLLPLAAGLLLLNNIDAMARIVSRQTTVPVPAEKTMIAPAPEAVSVEVATPLPPDDDKVYEVVDVMPEFPGGETELLKYMARNVKYPAESIKNKEEGSLSLSFIINKDGSLSDIKVVKSLTPLLDAEAVRVVKNMPKWTPGKVKGKVVRVAYTTPITYKYQ